MADGTTSLDSPNFGTSTGGAAGSAETTATLGVDRVDTRLPPDTSHVWGAQINNLKSTVQTMSEHFKGGTRLKTLTQTSNPFSASESGFYVDTLGQSYTVFNGTPTPINSASVGLGIVNVKSYGAAGDGVADDTAEIQAAVTAAGANSIVYFPPGIYKVTDTITISKDFVHLQGAGTGATKFTFSPTAARALFKVDQGATSTYGFSARGMYFTGNGAFQKIAFDCYDLRTANFSDLWINNGWESAGTSIGIRTNGREIVTMERVSIHADRPIVLSPNANYPNIGADHFHLTDTFLWTTSGAGRACLEIETGTPISNLMLDGSHAWIVDKYGLLWQDTTTVVASANVSLNGIRCEQAVDATGYGIYIDVNTGSKAQNVELRDVYVASAQNGILLKGIRNVSLTHCVSPINDAAKSHLVVDRMIDLKIDNCYWQVNTTATLTGMTLMSAMPVSVVGTNLPPTAWYSDATTATARAASLSSQIDIKGNTISYNGAANSQPITLDVNNAFSGASEVLRISNAGTRKAVVDNFGSFRNDNGVFDNIQLDVTGVFLGASYATAVTIGRAGKDLTLIGLLRQGLPQKVGSLASAGTIAPSNSVTHVTGVAAIATITAPANFAQTNGGGTLILIPDGVFTWTAAGNIAIAGTAVVNKALHMTYDNGTAKWYPSYV